MSDSSLFSYNVSIKVSPLINDEWVDWMKKVHINDVMATKCFISYSFFVLSEPIIDEEKTYVIQYFASSLNEIERYQKHFAPKIQADHSNKFKEYFVAFRTIMQSIK